MTFKAIGFDIDGTLYPSTRLYRTLIGLAMRNLRCLTAFNAVRHELRRICVTQEYRASPLTMDGLRRFQASLLARRLGMDDEAAFKLIERIFYQEIPESFRKVQPFTGVRETLSRLRDAGYRLGALSDFPGDRKLELMGLGKSFHVSMTSEETGFLKPAPRPMEALAERLGVSPSQMLYVGNSVAYDVVGAKAAGAYAALIKPLGVGDSGGADFVFRTYDELEKRLQGNP
jgi:putative hydrolase of the HAD superfamily